MKTTIVRHPEDNFYDDVRVRIVDRYKTSGLSGDEWRYSYLIELSRKGVVIAKRTVNDFEYACALVASVVHLGFVELESDDSWETLPWEQVPNKGICCHPGCSEPATNLYVRRCDENIDAHRSLSPPGWTLLDATLRSVVLRAALKVVDHLQNVELDKWLKTHPLEGPPTPIRFLEVLCFGRTAFEEWLTKQGYEFRAWDDGEHHGVMFEDCGEHWLAEFYDNGNFKQLVWA